MRCVRCCRGSACALPKDKQVLFGSLCLCSGTRKISLTISPDSCLLFICVLFCEQGFSVADFLESIQAAADRDTREGGNQ